MPLNLDFLYPVTHMFSVALTAILSQDHTHLDCLVSLFKGCTMYVLFVSNITQRKKYIINLLFITATTHDIITCGMTSKFQHSKEPHQSQDLHYSSHILQFC